MQCEESESYDEVETINDEPPLGFLVPFLDVDLDQFHIKNRKIVSCHEVFCQLKSVLVNAGREF